MKFILLFTFVGNLFATNFNPPVPNNFQQPFIYSGNQRPSHQFEGYLKSSEKINFKSAIYKEQNLPSYVRLDDEHLFLKSDTAKKFTYDFDSLIIVYYRSIIHYDSIKEDTVRYKAKVFENDWMFDKIKGKITLFTSDPPDGGFTYMQINGADILKYNEESLVEVLEKTPKSNRLLKNEKIGKGISIAMVIGGVASILVGFLNSDKAYFDQFGQEKHRFEASPLITIGAISMVGSWIPYLGVKNNFDKAIAVYNKQE